VSLKEDTPANGAKGDIAGPVWSEDEYVMDYRVLRALIGLIAFFLVPVVYVGNWLLFTRHVGGCLWPNPRIPGSLSGFYYTHMRNLFVGAMCAIGVFLVAYRGHNKRDNWYTNVAGLAALCIAVFPTAAPSYAPQGSNLFFTSSNRCGPTTPMPFHQIPHPEIAHGVHAGSLIVLFAMVFLMVLVQFTRTDQQPRPRRPAGLGDIAQRIGKWWKALFAVKQQPARFRNQVCVACAGVIAIGGLLALIAAIWPAAGNAWHLLLIAESLAFLSFGFAWFVKGAASASTTQKGEQKDEQRLVRALSRLAGGPRTKSADGSVPATTDQA
jgi:hypothetical protein